MPTMSIRLSHLLCMSLSMLSSFLSPTPQLLQCP
jgi:hypothetical protein